MPTPPTQLDSRVRVVTPENIAFEYRAAGPFTRIGAYLLDLLILAGLVFGLSALAMLAGGAVGLPGVGGMVMLIAWFGGQWFYCGLFEWLWNGQTPGKRSIGLRVLRTDGRPIAAWQAILRNLLRYIDLYPYIPMLAAMTDQTLELVPTCLIGLTAMACSPRHQRLGDLACSTMVVVEEPAGSGRAAKEWLNASGATRDPAMRQMLGSLPASFRPGRSLAQALSHYVNRRRYLGPERRREIAKHVGGPIVERLKLPADSDHDLLLCALYTRVFLTEEQEDQGPDPAEGGSWSRPDEQAASADAISGGSTPAGGVGAADLQPSTTAPPPPKVVT